MGLSGTELKQLQCVELEILSHFDEFCQTYNLKYYLIGGALLGAARYGGFIPWDDDIDVAMPREDYERLKTVYHSDKYFLQNFDTDPLFARCIQKIRRNGTKVVERSTANIPMHHGIYIDIFPIDYVDSDNSAALNMRGHYVRFLLSLSAIKRGYQSTRYRMLKYIIKKTCLISNRRIENKLFRLCTLENQSTRKYAVLWLHNYPWQKQIHDTSVFADGSLCLFEGKQFCAPAKPEVFLKKVFGETYMEEPPKDKQKMPHRYQMVEFSSSDSNEGKGAGEGYHKRGFAERLNSPCEFEKD